MADFGTAISDLKAGHRVTRPGWNGQGMYLELHKAGPDCPMTNDYIFMKTSDDNLVPWLASQTDMLAEDWTRTLNPETPAVAEPQTS